MDLSKFYDNYWKGKKEEVDSYRLNLIIKYVEPNKKVLDVRCGIGILSKKLKDKGAIVTGIDISTVAVERTKAKNINAIQYDFDCKRLPFKNDEFDYIIADSAIEHFFCYKDVVNECVRVLKPGGKFILSLPNIGHWRYRLWLLAGKFPYIENSPTDTLHIRFFTLYEAQKLCIKSGLTILNVDGTPSLWVKEFYPKIFRFPIIKQFYTWLARRLPSLFARDFILVCKKCTTYQ